MDPTVAERLLVLLKAHFFNRRDKAAIAHAKSGTPIPVVADGNLDALLRAHLLGQAVEKVGACMLLRKGISTASGWFRIGSYAPAPDNTTRWVCIDVDGAGHADGVADAPNVALKILDAFSRYGLPGHLERSGGGNGWHLWFLFDEPVSAATVREVALTIIPNDIPLAKGGYANPKKGQGIEVFPKQDKIDPEKGYGNLVWLPWWSEAKKGCSQFHKQECMELVPYIPEAFDTISPAQFEAAVERTKADTMVAQYETVPIGVNSDNFPDDWKLWRKDALDALTLEQVYGPWLTGRSSGNGWLECRDPSSSSGDQTPSAGVADGTKGFERGTFHSFITNETLSIFDFMVKAGAALSFRHALQRIGELSGKAFNFNGRSAPPRSTAPQPAGSKALPTIQTNNRQLKDIVHDAWESVMRLNTLPDIFSRQQSLVRLRRRGDELCVDDMTEDGVYDYISKTALWVKVAKDDVTDVFPPREVAKSMRATPSTALPELESVIACPVFAKSGALIAKPGYHADEKTWYEPATDLNVPEAPAAPTPAEIAAARDLLLEELAGDFPFVTESDRAHWMAALLLPFVRRMIHGPTPLHFVEAPCNGAGKSLLCDLVSILATGMACNAQTLPIHEDEVSKVITAELLKGQAIILLDNQNERFKLNSPTLASALTCQGWKGRMLGQTKMLTLPNHATWMMTGNNPNMTTEIARRSLRIRIDPKRDKAWTRHPSEFRHPKIKSWALENRNALICAIHTLVNAWLAAGKPAGEASMGSFEDWAGVIGGILAVADVPGFLDCLDEMYRQADADGEEWNVFVQRWWDEFADKPCKVSELNALCERENFLLIVRGDKSSRSQETRLGIALNSMRDRVFGELRITVAEDAKYCKGGRMYQLVKEQGEPPQGTKPDGQTELFEESADAPAENAPELLPFQTECGPVRTLVRTSNGKGPHIISQSISTTSETSADLCGRLDQSHADARARAYIDIIKVGYGENARACVCEDGPAQTSAHVRTEGDGRTVTPALPTTCISADLGHSSPSEGPQTSAQGPHCPDAPAESSDPPDDRGEAWEDPNYVPPTFPDGSRIPDPWDPDYDPAKAPYLKAEESKTK